MTIQAKNQWGMENLLITGLVEEFFRVSYWGRNAKNLSFLLSFMRCGTPPPGRGRLFPRITRTMYILFESPQDVLECLKHKPQPAKLIFGGYSLRTGSNPGNPSASNPLPKLACLGELSLVSPVALKSFHVFTMIGF